MPTHVPEPLFRFEDVSVSFGGRAVLDHLDMCIGSGGITVVVGPSGAGKSTLLRLCNRLTVPDTGKVLFRGEDVAGIDPLELRRAVGMVFQRPTPFAGTVRENLLVADPRASEQRLRSLLAEVGLDPGFADRQATELSGGEAQRVCLARALAADPEVVLMDEPTSSLDPENRSAIERLARQLAASGSPVVWVTHQLDQARRLDGQLVVLMYGRVASDEEARNFLAGEAAESGGEG